VKLKLLFLVSLLLINGCTTQPNAKSNSKAEKLFAAGYTQFNAKNYKKSFDFFYDSCRLGDVEACGMLPYFYEKDLLKTGNKKKNMVTAKNLYKTACEMGDKDACIGYSRMSSILSGNPCHRYLDDYKESFDYIIKYQPRSCKRFETLLKQGRKVQKSCDNQTLAERDYYKSIKMLKKTYTWRRCY